MLAALPHLSQPARCCGAAGGAAWKDAGSHELPHTHLHNPPPPPAPPQSLCDLALRFGEDDEDGGGGMSRPFGVALLVAGWDAEGGPAL